MRLAKLTAYGFKSFGDRTEIAFDAPITGVVGPNGCGKSNIVDAVKWVLGTQSAKSLRGSAMLDVIFNGTSARRPAGMASVTLTFDNPLRPEGGRALPLDADQVAVTRQLFRDGASEYLINKRRVRLRDVKELFMDTGVGTEAYCIIEQGKVARMLEANPQERREIFEEAAGVSRFKARRKETERRLERIDQNLGLTRARLEEVQRRLRSVKLQAGKARTHQELTQRLRELQLRHALAEHHRLAAAVADLAQRIEQAEADHASAARAMAQRERAHADAQLERQALAQSQKEIEQDRLQRQAQRAQAQQRRQFAHSSLEDLRKQVERQTAQATDLAQRAQRLAREAQEHHAAALDTQQAQASASQAQQQAEQEHRAAQHQLNERRSTLDDEKAGVMNLLRRSSQLQNEVRSLDQFTRTLEGARDKLGRRASEVGQELERLLTGRDEAQLRLDEVLALIDAQQKRQLAVQQEAASLSQDQRRLSERLATAKERRASLQSRRNLLHEMQERQEGVADAVKAVLARKASRDGRGAASAPAGGFECVRGLLADLLEADVEHATLVEAALGEHQQALVVDSLESFAQDAGQQALASLGGRVGFIAIDQAWLPADTGSPEPRDLPRLVDFVRFPSWLAPLAWSLLGRTRVAPTLEEAIEARRRLPAGCRVVTPRGELVEADGRLIAGPLGGKAGTGLISRRSELAQLRTQIEELDGQIASDSESLAQLGDRVAHAAKLAQQVRQALFEANTAKVELSGRLGSLGAQIARLEKEQPVIAAETEQLHRQMHDAAHQRRGHEEEAARVDAESRTGQQRVEEIQREIAELSRQAEAARERLTAARVEATRLAERLASTQRQARQAELAGADLERQLRSVQEQLAGHAQRAATLEQTIEESSRLADEAAALLQQAETQLAEVRARVEQAEVNERESLAAVTQQRAALEALDRACQALRMEHRELEVKAQGLRDRCREQLDLDIAEAYAQACTPASSQAAEGAVEQVEAAEPVADPVAPEMADGGETVAPAQAVMETAEATVAVASTPAFLDGFDNAATESEIKALRDRVARLGPVNLDAIAEQQELEGRQTEMETQVRDIEQAQADLRALIQQINDDSRKRFEETFAAVREHFAGPGGLFRKLFGGGKADLFLQPDEQGHIDVLESGIEILAKPPGKEPQSIRLLSGGEKTMTAVALLLSIFQTKPSPFAILDEVDAALDEANVSRFANILTSFLDRSHFIVITHNKATMQVCDLLYGITMQDRGVSKRVAVRFDQIGSGGQISQQAIEAQAAADREAERLAAERASEAATPSVSELVGEVREEDLIQLPRANPVFPSPSSSEAPTPSSSDAAGEPVVAARSMADDGLTLEEGEVSEDLRARIIADAAP